MQPSSELKAWTSGGEMRALLEHRMFVRVAETAGKPPLLLIHGYPTSSYDWCSVWPALAARYSLYTLDLLGFGQSDKPLSSDYAIALQADLCMQLLSQHGVGSVHVLAHDYGDTVAQELLAREREGVLGLDSVVFLNGGLFPETHRARLIQKLLAKPVLGPWLASRMTFEHYREALLSLWGRRPPSAAELEDFWLLTERNGGRRAIARLINYMAQRRRNRPRWVGALVESRVPRMLICGALDPVSGAHLASRYRELVPAPNVVLLDDVGHYPQIEAPQRVLEAYLLFRETLAQSAHHSAMRVTASSVSAQ
jgi:pimeloyl-ACP methyl ester carboxylesterase